MLINVLIWMLANRVLKVGDVSELGFYLNLAICSALIFSIILGGKIAFVGCRADDFLDSDSRYNWLTRYGHLAHRDAAHEKFVLWRRSHSP